MEKLLITVAAALAALSSTANATASKAVIVMVTEAVWSDGSNPPITESSNPEPVNDRTYVSMMRCREVLANDHAAYAAQTAKEFKFLQSSRYRAQKHLIRRSVRARCWIGPLPTKQEELTLPEE
jgi:hypothetical protein